MTGILRGLGRGIQDITAGINQGLPVAINQWQMQKQMAAQAQQENHRLKMEGERIQQAADQAQAIMDRHNDSIGLQRLQIEMKPVSDRIASNRAMQAQAIELGNAQVQAQLNAELDQLLGMQQELLGRLSPSDGVRLTAGLPDPKTPNVVAAGLNGVEIPTGAIEGVTPMDVSSALALGFQDRNLWRTVQGLGPMAARDPDAAMDVLRGKTPNITPEQEERVRGVLNKLRATPAYTNIDWDKNVGWDPLTNRPVNIPGGPMAGKMTGQQASMVSAAHDDWRMGNPVKMYGASRAGFAGGREGYYTNDAAGDIALLYGFAKAVAPDDSAVREGEFATMEQAQGWFAKVQNMPLKILEGRRLEKDARRRVFRMLHNIYRARRADYVSYSQQMADMFQQRDLKPEWIIPGWQEMQPDGMELQPTAQLIQKLAADSTNQEIIRELRERFGVMPEESLSAILEDWLKGEKK